MCESPTAEKGRVLPIYSGTTLNTLLSDPLLIHFVIRKGQLDFSHGSLVLRLSVAMQIGSHSFRNLEFLHIHLDPHLIGQSPLLLAIVQINDFKRATAFGGGL